MFTQDITDALAAPLDKASVKSRKQAGRDLSYIEAWHAIAEANRIFGFDGWDRETVELVQLGEPREVNGKWRVGYRAKVRIRVDTSGGEVRAIVREGCGFGSGIDNDVDQAHESALKEAESDAMKRALMTFGNPFGLALYDKTQANVVEAPQPPPTPVHERGVYIAAKAAIDLAEDIRSLTLWAKDNEASLAKIKASEPDTYEAVLAYWKARKDELTPKVTA